MTRAEVGLGYVVEFVCSGPCCSFGGGVLVRVDAWLTKAGWHLEKSIDVAGHRWREVRNRPRRDQLVGPHATCRHLIIVCILATCSKSNNTCNFMKRPLFVFRPSRGDLMLWNSSQYRRSARCRCLAFPRLSIRSSLQGPLGLAKCAKSPA